MTQQRKPYTEAIEVEATEMRQGNVFDREKYAFYVEVCKRLEQTNGRTAIRYKFADEKEAQLYRNYVEAHMRKDRGKGALSTARKWNDTGVYVYFARGKNY